VTALASLAAAFMLTSPAFHAGAMIPARYTCDGAGGPPPLRWTAPPRRTRSLALRVTDPDAPGGTFVHWIEWRAGSHWVQGTNSFGRVGYSGPCPPAGAPHRYVFRLYALNRTLALRSGASADAFAAALRGHVLATATLVGRYSRS